MNKKDFFLGSMRDNADYAREWILRSMSVVIDPPKDIDPWMVRHRTDSVEVCVPDGDGWKWEVLEGVAPYEIPFVYHEFTGPIPKGALQNLDRDLEDSTWGDLLFNHRTLCYATGSSIPFKEGPIDVGAIEAIFAKRMKSDPLPGEPDDPNEIYTRNWKRYGKAIGDLAGYEMFIPSVSERALRAPDDNLELRTRLLEENKDSLDDPVTQARIQDALVKNYVDKQLKGDPSEGFIYSKKSLNTAIKRMFLIHGPEAGFSQGGQAKLVINSLAEGIDVDEYPLMVNSLRAGSFYRGALTALAGEDVDLMSRIFQNSRITKEFCGTKLTKAQMISKDYMGRYLLVDGERVEVTEENLPRFDGVVMAMYSPGKCLASHNDTCSICLGSKLSAHENSLGSMVADAPQTMMQVMMGSAHAKELKTTPLDVANFLR